jgi:WD40 repeat protein
VVTASEDGMAILWNVVTADEVEVIANKVAVLKGHKDAINTAVFSPDGRLLLTASEDGELILWAIYDNLQTLVDHAKKVVNGRGLTHAEHKRIFPY